MRLRLGSDPSQLRDLVSEISWAKVSNVGAERYPGLARSHQRDVAGLEPEAVARVFARYEELKRDFGRLPLNDAGERMLAALALSRRYPEATLVFTGLYDETLRHEWRDDSARGLLFYPELSGRRVVFLGEARSTYEEALLTIERLTPAPGSTWLLVTSALHMPRALGTFTTLGWKLTPFPVDYRSAAKWAWRFEVKVGQRLASLDAFVREWGAYQVYKLNGRITE